jgi:uncharacterized protein (TIGR02996 family)
MTQEELLLQRVLEHPDDDGPRLDYAAYMTNRKDPRGEFVQIEVELARMDKDTDPNYLPLAEAAYAKIDQHGPALAGPVAAMVDNYFFDRGFVELVELSVRRFLEIAPELYSRAPVRHLNLKGSRSFVPELFSSSMLDPIRSLDIGNWKLIDQDMEVLASSPHLKQLRWLSIADNLVGLPGAEALAASRNLPNLRYVVFTGNPVNPSERYGSDSGYIVDSWMKDEGSLLEEKYGPIRWLHADPPPNRITDVPPSRFMV